MNNFYINKRVNPKGLKKNEYDAIIIGAGIGGLVCGCYLAKAGMKVLIVEKNDKPGGYCTSFERNGYKFDVGVHSLGNCKEGGEFRRILIDLDIDKRIRMVKCDPSDSLITLQHNIRIRNSLKDTINEFQSNFPKESRNIKAFFDFIAKSDFPILYAKLRGKTFRELLDNYFSNNNLKSLISIPLGNIGLPSTMASALVAVVLYREFILYGGYYPLGGMGTLADLLADSFKMQGGYLAVTKKVKRIAIKTNKAKGVIIEDGEFVSARYIISNCDVRQTFIELVGREWLSNEFVKLLNTLSPSVSVFAVYIGVDKELKEEFKNRGNIWYAPLSDVDKVYINIAQGKLNDIDRSILITSPSYHDKNLAPEGRESLILLSNAPFKGYSYWRNRKKWLANRFIKRAGEIIGDISKSIQYKGIATPYTLYNYTLNYEGAAYGWAAIPSQIESSLVSQRTEIGNLFLCGHWCMEGAGQSGVSTVAYSGRSIAKRIIKRYNKTINKLYN